jgi:hypothetical protein
VVTVSKFDVNISIGIYTKKNTTKLKQLNIPLYLNKTKSPGDENHHIFPLNVLRVVHVEPSVYV